MIGDSKTKPMEILLVEDGLTDARITIYALRRSHVYHRLTLVRTVGEAIQFLKRDGIFARAPQPDLLLLNDRDLTFAYFLLADLYNWTGDEERSQENLRQGQAVQQRLRGQRD